MALLPSKTFSMPSVQELNDLTNFCRIMAQCPFYQKLQVGGVMAIYLTAKEMNLPFMASLNGGLLTFDGKVTLSAQFMNMMIVNAGHRADVVHLDDKSCSIIFFRSDRPKGKETFEYTYTIEMAAKAGYLSKNNWKTSPRDMLFSRALSGGARKFMPDVISSYYVQGEMGPEDGEVTPDVPPIETISKVPAQEKQTVLLDLEETPEEIERRKQEDLEKKRIERESFKKRHSLNCNQPAMPKVLFLRESCEKSGLSEDDMINAMMRNEDLFEKRFEKWVKGKNPPQEAIAPTAELENVNVEQNPE